MFNRIVLNIPHSSPLFPFGKECWENGIDAEIQRWTDWYTDWLFQPSDARIIPVSYPFSRFFCDVERLENDPLESIGQGVVYERFNGLKRSLSSADVRWLKESYSEHLFRLQSLISDSRTLVLDCHSFPADLSDIEVCIGFNDDWSRPSDKMIDYIKSVFLDEGYIVGVNNPYSNSITPSSRYAYKSLMIELNKSLYLDGENSLAISRAQHIRGIIQKIYCRLLRK